MSRTAQTHDRGNAPRKLQHATRGRHLPPSPTTAHCNRRDLRHGVRDEGGRAASSMGPGSRATLSPVAQKGENEQDAANAPRIGNTANRLALGRPIGESAIT